MHDLSTRYALLTQLPLFRGVSSTELLGWEDALKLFPDELPASHIPLIRQGEHCSHLLFLVEGELYREHCSAEGNFTLHSYIQAPAVIEADRLFGLTPTYKHTYTAKSDIKILAIRKTFISSHFMKNEVFRLNLLNLLSATAQKRDAALRPLQLNNPEDRLWLFLERVFIDCDGEVEIHILMDDLARYIGETRLTVSRLLNRWQEEGLIRLGRGKFVIHDIRKCILIRP
jgi:CRP-like cAMP-binding protein